jgi:hypothetical protein
MVIAASQEAQKVAETALRDCAGWFTQEPDGAGPLGTTHNADFLDPATAPVVYASSRIRERWVIGPSQSFGDVARLLATDARCDLSVVPFSTNLERYRFDAGRDCVAQLAEFERAYFKCLEMQMEPTWVVGELFPVAFGSQVVFLKFCSGHLSAFCRKYEIDFNECQILEPWENEGNHW